MVTFPQIYSLREYIMDRPLGTIFYEAIVLGAVTFAVSVAIYTFFAGELPKFEFNNMLLSWFLVGALSHVVMEVLGWNEKWCRSVYV